MTFVLGLTGSIGMGKSATAAMFRRARRAGPRRRRRRARALSRRRRAARSRRPFPGTVADGVVDRAALGSEVLGEPERLKRLEAIVHPLVRAERDASSRGAVAARAPVAVLDIPLLFETGGEARLRRGRSSSPRAGRGAARARARPAGHDGGEVRGDPREADAGRGKAGTGALPCGHRPRLCCRRAPGPAISCGRSPGGRAACSPGGRGLKADACARSSSTPRPPAPIRPPATASSRSAASSSSTTFPTGRTFHAYLNPQRPVSQGAFDVHGLSDAFLADKPVFAAVAETFLRLRRRRRGSSSTTPPSTSPSSTPSSPAPATRRST